MSDNIKVVVKVRPLIAREVEDKLFYQWRVRNSTLYQIDQNGRDCGQNFTFDKVYDKDAKTSEVYNDIAKPIVEAAIAGINGTIFAYGQTSSGKTHTMTGTDDSPGIIHLAVLNLFDLIRKIPDRDFLLRVSFVEIYNETLIDLLDVTKNIKICDTHNGVRVDTTEKVTSSPGEVLEFMKQGEANRQTASTNMNDKSSRSHSIFQITIESREHTEDEEEVGSVNISQLNLVDLAGSERAGQTGATGIRFKEGTHINKSLSVLALVIKQLSEGQNKHVSYRDSKLTRILQNSLGGNAKTSIICAVTPAVVEETISTLQFACRAKAIKNRPEVNAVATSSSMIQNLTKQLCALKTALENKRNVEQDNCNLQKQIAHLQKLILNGFHQRNSSDLISGARRKLCPPRRMTISTLHPIQEDTTPSIPKFCTPSLKYNALLIPGGSGFAPISSESLSCLTEAPTRAITPPSRDKKVQFNDEIIEIDSDDDTPTDVPICSPYHKCYDSSKTPPCILRKNYKEAEKNYKDIVKFTEREKVYGPHTDELIKQLEEKSLALNKVKTSLSALTDVCKEKDKQIEQLQETVTQTEIKLKNITTAKLDLDAHCLQYQTKLTDWEVSYDTLMKKTKIREKELLSLLEENSRRKMKENGTMYSPPKSQEQNDLSDGCRITESDSSDSDLASKQIRDMAAELEAQIVLKEQTIIELQATISADKLNIETLENVNRETKKMLSDYKQNVLLIETENDILKSKISDLNSLVESQNSEIKTFNADIDSYNTVIKDLQEKILQKDKLLISNTIVDDKDIESLIAIEESFIANNENIRNIINSLKNILDSKNEEIEKLKASLTNEEQSSKDSNNYHEEIQNIKQQLEENQNTNSKYVIEIEKLKEQNADLISTISTLEEKYTIQEEILKSKTIQLESEINTLEETIQSKENIISSFINENQKTQENLNTAKLTLNKLQDVIILLSGNIQGIPDMFDDFASVFKVFGDNLKTLECVVQDSIEDKKSLQELINKHEKEIIKLQKELDNASEIVDSASKDFIGLTQTSNNSVADEESAEFKLASKIKTLIDGVQHMQDIFDQSINSKDTEINNLRSDIIVTVSNLNDKSKELESKSQELQAVLVGHDNILHGILNKIVDLVLELKIENISVECSKSTNSPELISEYINKLASEIRTIQAKNESNYSNSLQEIADATAEIKQLNDENIRLNNALSQLKTENSNLCEEIISIKTKKEDIIDNLTTSNKALSQLQIDLEAKSSEIDVLQSKALEWKEQFLNLDTTMKQELDKLEFENSELKKELERLSSNKSIVEEEVKSNSNINKAPKNSKEIVDLKSPQSLLTICCDTILDAIQPSENETSTCPSTSNTSLCESKVQLSCRCDELQSKVDILQIENENFKMSLHNLQDYNKSLVLELEEAKGELLLLLDLTHELQRKIVNHRTNLSTLTATTYAENISLSSQLRSLQHYHSLFYRSCEKDIPEVKKDLQELMALLKTGNALTNESCRRYSLPTALENSAIQPSKCESMLDGDLLMLDTNITLTTCDNTLTGHEQSCFDATQSSIDVDCQTNNCSGVNDIQNPSIPRDTARKILQNVESLKLENNKLREIVEEYELIKQNKLKYVDSQISPIKLVNFIKEDCEKCLELQENIKTHNDILNENDTLRRQLAEVTSLKDDIEAKYKTSVAEIASTEALLTKLKNFEKDLTLKSQEISKLTSLINTKNKELVKLQEENDSLSNQVMDNIYETETLKKEIDSLKQNNLEVSQKHAKLQEEYDILDEEHFNSNHIQDKCQECIKKDDIIKSLQSTVSVSRYNKICTLQSELHAGKEDCNELKNEVTNIKNHLDKSNISIVQAMDLDDSIGDSNVMPLKKSDLDPKFMPDLPKERPLDMYTLDKVDCVNYCIQNTGLDEESFTCDMKIIDVMKLLYTNVLTKHNNEIENLVNRLKDFEESKLTLQSDFNNLMYNQETLSKEINEKNVYLQAMANAVASIKNNLSCINNTINESELSEVSIDIIDMYKNTFFKFIDKEFGLSSLETFDLILNLIEEKHRSEMIKLSEGNNCHRTISENVEMLNKELETVKSDLHNKEKENNLLVLQKEKMFEINNCVTLNIVKNDQFLRDTTNEIYQELVSKNLIDKDVVNMSMPFNEIIPIMFKCATQQQQSINEENTKLTVEINTMKVSLDEKNRELSILQEEISKVSNINAQISEALNDKEAQLKEQISVHDILKCTYDKKVEENNTNLTIITNLTDQINIIKETIKEKEVALQALESQLHSQQNNSQIAEAVKELQIYKDEIDKLKLLNNILNQEKESASVELQKANDIIKQNKIDLEKITSDMLILKEAVDQSSNEMESLRSQSKTLLDQNKLLKEEIKEKTKEFSRLETNIKTYQKSAEFQCKMISRLKKEKADIEKSNTEYIEKLSELTALLDELKSKDALHSEEVNSLKSIKASLENRISELEKDVQSKRMSIEVNGNRSRRQSLYDSHRTFSENDDDPKKVEAVFKSRKCDDLFMDVDEGSNRSTPIRLSKGRDSLASRHEQSEEEGGSRASSVQASRRRRQSIHDAYRGALDTSRRQSGDRNNESSGSDSASEVSKLRKQLSVCKEELEEWKEKFREVDEECEICAQYLRERDEQCRQLKVDKRSLEITIEELKEKVQGVNISKTSSVDIAVNTEEDWANLHSVVVDRMSYDAEVEKNKKLSRTIEDLRYQKQELKKTLTKMQKSIERNATKDGELETIRSELKDCQKELEEVKARNRELDEECETCSEYLKERDEQIKKLKEAKKALEIKLMDYEDSSICLSVRKKRQTLHDRNRHSNGELVDAATETCADLNIQPERDENSKEAELHSKEYKRLKCMVEKLTQQKASLEQQLAAMTSATPLYVSTGSSIVQQQQFSDVIKENQKLKSMNVKLSKICRKMKSQNTNRENEDPADEINM
ncbi:kinesin-related protein 4 [Pieris rapae]|uniref:kinesin-related protein 4 n=1 Tax=Pieris rapae TaxID=64459 RepID=UPI001E2808BB|nr:kinesin-related protein 4 [Pieris rapae]